MRKPWLQHYPAGVPEVIDPDLYLSVPALVDAACRSFADREAFVFMGRGFSFAALDEKARDFAAYLQSLGLAKGERIALMMPNVPQYPVAVLGALRAGLVVVNTNPLYTPRELAHQLKDSGARAIVVLENMAATLAACRSELPELRHLVVTALGDELPAPKRQIVNLVVRHVKKLVPAYSLPEAVSWRAALRKGKGAAFTAPDLRSEDLAVLQYTGGTTGVAKGAMLLHRNLVANVLQAEAWYGPAVRTVPEGTPIVTICALPIYHIFGFTVNMLLTLRLGGCTMLIPNARDIGSVIEVLKSRPFHSFPAVNTLFGAIARHPEAKSVDWSTLKISLGGGMAVQAATAEAWLKLTGRAICEGYGLSETSPTACCNPVLATEYSGTIGLPISSTDMAIVDDEGREVAVGERGEIAIRGPQVMAGYWQRPGETAAVMTADRFFRSGDVGVMDEAGRFRIVDRKKDMIIVSGFNVYPNEVEDVVTQMPGVVEAAAIGVPDEVSGEAVKLVVVRGDQSITADRVRAFCKDRLTGYKRPKHVEFREELPKTNVGKVLRRALRE